MASDAKNKTVDTTGRDRFAKNVFTSWGSHIVLIIIGFVVPRMIDTHLGKSSLGIWDMSWSFVNYLSLSGLGVGSSVNRYVAKYYSGEDYLNLNKSVSSVVAIQAVIAVVIVIGTGGLVFFLPNYLEGWDPKELSQAVHVVALLGLSLAVQMLFDTFRGITTGVHRWDLHNGLNAASSITSAVLMIIVMLLGYDLVSLAVVYLCVNIVAEFARVYIGFSVCPNLQLRMGYVSRSHAKQMFGYGMKSVVVGAPQLIVVQTINIALAGAVGAGALAVFMRPIALIRHIETFINKFAFVLTPTVGSLIGIGKSDQIREVMIQSTRYSVAMTLPMMLVLGILGDHILTVWMGHDYADMYVIAVLAFGSLLSIAQAPTLRVIMGMNLHGKVAIITFVISIVMLVVGILFMNSHGWTLIGAAILTGSIRTITRGIVIPIYACNKIGISLPLYLRESFGLPILANVVLASWLFLSRYLGGDSSLQVLLIGMVGTMLLLPAIYWPMIKPLIDKKLAKKNSD
jgi:O-antigen/teichoic acid export membrane protein